MDVPRSGESEDRCLADGQAIRETYEVERFLGEGAFAEVYRVKHRFLGRQAMKVFKTTGMTMPEIEDVLSEAILLSRIGHPNIVRVFDANTVETRRGVCGFFTMEYVAGGSLDQFWKSHGWRLVPVSTTVEILSQCCRGMTTAHGEDPPIVHRDIKPQNILVGYDAGGLRVRVSDFGLAKRVNPLTLMASSRGTRSFKAPEAFLDFESDSCAGDVWALGCTLYLLLTDQLPYSDAGEVNSFAPDPFNSPLVPPGRINPGVNPSLDSITSCALALRPQDRYPTARELLADLVQWTPNQRPSGIKSSGSAKGDGSKLVLGARTPANEYAGRQMAGRAFELAGGQGKLSEAADLLEESFNHWPDLREEHEYWVKLWRKGIAG